MTDELKRFTHEDIADDRLTCLKLLIIIEKGMQDKKTDEDREMEEIYVYNIATTLPEALDEIERLQSQLAARDALIERLIKVAEIKFRTSMPMNEQAIEYGGKWQKLVAEWRAMKGGEE